MIYLNFPPDHLTPSWLKCRAEIRHGDPVSVITSHTTGLSVWVEYSVWLYDGIVDGQTTVWYSMYRCDTLQSKWLPDRTSLFNLTSLHPFECKQNYLHWNLHSPLGNYTLKFWSLHQFACTERAIMLFNRNLPTRCQKTSLRAFISWIAGMALSMR